MSNLRLNTIAGTGLAAVLAVLGLGELSHAVFHVEYPEEPAYEVAIETAAPSSGGQAEEDAPIDWGRLFADEAQLTALVAQGEQAHRVCTSCHSFNPGGPNQTGPALYGVFGRAAASHPGFNYSPSMQAYGKEWSYQNLYDYLEAPARYVPGTTMAFAGVGRSENRVALVAYLRSLSPSPAPLPAPLPEAVAEPTPAGPAEAPAEGVESNAPGIIDAADSAAAGGPVAPGGPPATPPTNRPQP